MQRMGNWQTTRKNARPEDELAAAMKQDLVRVRSEKDLINVELITNTDYGCMSIPVSASSIIEAPAKHAAGLN